MGFHEQEHIVTVTTIKKRSRCLSAHKWKIKKNKHSCTLIFVCLYVSAHALNVDKTQLIVCFKKEIKYFLRKEEKLKENHTPFIVV
jgi:hypothetical protein